MRISSLLSLPIHAWRAIAGAPKPQGRVIVFCGAGLSAPSGLSVYRGAQGSWTLDPQAQAAMDMDHWPASRERALDHLALWRAQALASQPNDAHRRLARWKRQWPERVFLITQNVDGLLQRAGLDDAEVLEVHGSLHRMRCMECLHEWPMGEDNGEPCPACLSALTKPSVVFFHEQAPKYAEMDRVCDPATRLPGDIFLAVGTSWRVVPPERLMATRGRAMGQQLSVDSREQPELAPWLHGQSSAGAVEGLAWAEREIFKHWASMRS